MGNGRQWQIDRQKEKETKREMSSLFDTSSSETARIEMSARFLSARPLYIERRRKNDEEGGRDARRWG